MQMKLCNVAMTTVFVATLLSFKVSAQCTYGQVRLVGGSGTREGRVEICFEHRWGAVQTCDDNWDDDIARVVCRQLDYVPDGAKAVAGASFGQGNSMIALDSVECNSSIHCTLLQCPHNQNHGGNCGAVGVRCEQNIVKNVNAANVTTPKYNTLRTVLINVTLVNNSITNLFQVECYNQQHGVYVNISVSNEMNSFASYLKGLFPSSFYTCCTGVLDYCQRYVARDTCISIKTSNNHNYTQTESKTLTTVSLVGGVLGFIIVLLFLLIALVCLLQPNLRKLVIPKRRRLTTGDLSPNTSTLAVENLRYAALPSSQATSPTYAQVGRSSRQEDESAPNYSILGPAHAIVDQGRQQGSQNRISSNVHERYEFAEIHNMETDRQDRL